MARKKNKRSRPGRTVNFLSDEKIEKVAYANFREMWGEELTDEEICARVAKLPLADRQRIASQVMIRALGVGK